MNIRLEISGYQRGAVAVAALLVLAVAWAVQRFVGWSEVARLAAAISRANWAAFVALLAVSYVMRVVRVWRLLRDIHAEALLARAIPVFFVHNVVVTILPGRIGEVAMPYLARRWIGADWGAAIGALAWWRVADTAIVAALALVLLATGARVLVPLYMLALAACVAPFVLFALRGSLLRVVQRPGVERSYWAALVRRGLRGIPSRPSAIVADLALALVAWTTKIASFAVLIVGALDGESGTQPREWTHVAAAALAGDVAGALPVPTIGGVGMYEGGIVLGLTALEVPPAEALAIGVLLHGALLASIVLTGLAGLAAGMVAERDRSRFR